MKIHHGHYPYQKQAGRCHLYCPDFSMFLSMCWRRIEKASEVFVRGKKAEVCLKMFVYDFCLRYSLTWSSSVAVFS